MKRTSELAARLSRGLDLRGLPTSPRRLERWSHAGLGPDDETSPFEGQLDHFAKLRELSRSGHDAKVTARRMAAYGHKCKSLHQALPDLGNPPALPELNLSSGPDGDSSFAFVESEARDMLLHADSLPPLAVNLLKALLANGARHSSKLEGERPVSTLYSAVVSTLFHAMGGDFYNLKGMAALLNLDPDDFTAYDQDALNQLARFHLNELGAAYCAASTDDIVAAAQLLREHGRELLDHIGVSGVTDAQIEELAAVLAPGAVYLMQRLSRHFPDFPPVLPSMLTAA